MFSFMTTLYDIRGAVFRANVPLYRLWAYSAGWDCLCGRFTKAVLILSLKTCLITGNMKFNLWRKYDGGLRIYRGGMNDVFLAGVSVFLAFLY